MNQSSLIFAQILYVLLLVAITFLQRKELVKYYKDVLKAIGLTFIVPLCFVVYGQSFPATLDENSSFFFIWYPGIPIIQALVYGYCIYAFKSVRALIATLFIGETVAFIYLYFIYSMMVTGDWI